MYRKIANDILPTHLSMTWLSYMCWRIFWTVIAQPSSCVGEPSRRRRGTMRTAVLPDDKKENFGEVSIRTTGLHGWSYSDRCALCMKTRTPVLAGRDCSKQGWLRQAMADIQGCTRWCTSCRQWCTYGRRLCCVLQQQGRRCPSIYCCDATYDVPHRTAPTMMEWRDVTRDEVDKLISAVPNKMWQLNPVPTKDMRRLLKPFLSMLFKKSYTTGCFSSQFKEAVVRSLLKKTGHERNGRTIDLFRTYNVSSNYWRRSSNFVSSTTTYRCRRSRLRIDSSTAPKQRQQRCSTTCC